MVRVLIVDDSATMRGLISATLQRDEEIEIVGQAADAQAAREAIKMLNPDVVTLDIEMPNMNGLDFLEKIMKLRPTPVVMVSTLTEAGAEASLRALEIGAVDCVAKPGGGRESGFNHLAETVKNAARARVRPWTAPERSQPPATQTSYRPNGSVVAIGSSTGGVEALIDVLSRFPSNCPPTVITQHMPGAFTRSFADRLNRLCAPEVSEAIEGAPLAQGRIYLAPGGEAHLSISSGPSPRCRLTRADPVSGHRPSVDVLFDSVAKACGSAAVGVILTGMGRDGSQGLMRMRDAGARTIGQDEATSLVYGMPKAAFELGAVQKQAALSRIAHEILTATQAPLRENR